ncbi:MAG: hypothetical protein ACPGOY_00130 [Rhodospirillaceae bacterium]
MRCSANPLGLSKKTAVLAVFVPLLGACSAQSVPYAVEAIYDSRAPRETLAACDRAFERQRQAPDPIERRRWEIYREDLDCPQVTPETLGEN